MSRFHFMTAVAILSVLLVGVGTSAAQSPFVNLPGQGPLIANYGYQGCSPAPVITVAPPVIAAPFLLPPVRVFRPAPVVTGPIGPIWRHRHHRAHFHPWRFFLQGPGIVVR
ncbi:MAG: hypothetical protein FJ271_12920 [Planctomycetes bacterium]|nr:hypothetical protein [Planctomycetota bacterium]